MTGDVPADATLAWEDLAVGQSWRTDGFTLDEARIVRFGEEYDPQPQHLSREAAAGSMFGELVASGWQTAAISLRLSLTAGGPRLRRALGAGVEELRWVAPVRPGDTLFAVITVEAVRPLRSRADRGLVRLRWRTENQRGETVMEMVNTILVERRDPSAG